MKQPAKAPQTILDLVARFSEHSDTYRRGDYNETQLRRDFLDPFFEALGWDIHNRQGYAEAYRDVIHEDALRVEKTVKAPDYCFRIGGVRKFFVEAKKPSVDIKQLAAPAFQLRRYAWTAKLPLSILTGFEGFAVYDCRIQPDKDDKASVARVMYLQYTEFAERWDEIAGIFSREAILHGSFDKYAESNKRKRGTAEVDDAFLEEIESWRSDLARNIALRNSISQRDLNFAVQRIIDRIVFLRICEDRGIEPYATLQALRNGPQVYKRLVERFYRADERYNSGLFQFENEKDRTEGPDDITPGLTIDDKPLKDILGRLYYPDSPYEFAVLPAEILGQVYERFLGKIIRLTAGHQAKIEEKPEVRKAGGVYYTPAYIVDYIVKNTVGELVEGKSPQEVGGLTDAWKPSKTRRPITVLDPACGSGSFLLGAYQFLLNWYRDQYVDDGPKKHASGREPRLYQQANGQWWLTTAERKRILLAHIYGVDIDTQAVEVTKLSLLLKVLEGESDESLERQLRLLHERALPDLGNNIKCGNSLIGPDFYNGHQLALFNEDERLRINIFDWSSNDGFPDIIRSGGFDTVIGNPPYIQIQTLFQISPEQVGYFGKHYEVAAKGNYDIYVVFVERAMSLLRKNGYIGFILPNKFFTTDYGLGIRRLISDRRALRQLVDFRHGQVFADATTYTCLLFLENDVRDSFSYVTIDNPPTLNAASRLIREIPAENLSERPWSFASAAEAGIEKKLTAGTRRLLDLPASMSRGSSTGADDVFMLRKRGRKLATRDGDPVDMEAECLRIPIYATDFSRYKFEPQSDERVIFPYSVGPKHARILAESELRNRFPKCYAYLRGRKAALVRRKQFAHWYGFSAPRNLILHRTAQLMVPLLANMGLYCKLPDKLEMYCPMASGGFTIGVSRKCKLPIEYLLGLCNSKLLYWKLSHISNVFRGGWITCTKQYVGELPIKYIDDSSEESSRRLVQRIAESVRSILDLHQRLSEVKGEHEKTALRRQIDAIDSQIDQLVYELYSLTADEIRLVEETTKS